jgi:hypothetical protein
MHQLRVFRCDICHAPFLFESSLEDHRKEHAPRKENDHAFVMASRSRAKPRLQKKKSRAKRKK